MYIANSGESESDESESDSPCSSSGDEIWDDSDSEDGEESGKVSLNQTVSAISFFLCFIT